MNILSIEYYSVFKVKICVMMRIAMMIIRVVSKVYFSSGHLQRGEVRHEEDKQLVEMKSVYKCRNV